MKKTAKHTRITKLVLIVLAAVLIAVVGALAFAGNYLFHFALDPSTPNGMVGGNGNWPQMAEGTWLQSNGEDRWLTSRDGLSLHALYVSHDLDNHKYAVLCHGYGSIPQSMSKSAARFYDMGFHILAPAARAHEQSGGTYVSMGWLERMDIVDWISTIVAQDPDAEVVLYGISMGGATVMMTAGESLPENVKCIVEDCGYSSVWDEFAVQLQEMFGLPTFPVLDAASLVTQARAGFGFKEASSVEQLKKATIPMLFIHGEDDTFVPYSMLDVVYAACASEEKERLSIPGAAHGQASSVAPELYWSTVKGFLDRHISWLKWKQMVL